jgi:hypothetical protein
VLAVVTVPSPLILANIFGPLLVPLAFGTILPETILVFGALAVLVIAWLVGGAWFAAATEVALIRDAVGAADAEGLPIDWMGVRGSRPAGRAAAARLLVHVPTAIALGFSGVAIVAVTYQELTDPSDASPLVLRVVSRTLGPLAVVAAWWLFGEVVGSIAVRRIVLDGSSVLRSIARALVDLVRHPVSLVVVPLAMTAILAIDIAATLAIVAIVLLQVRDRLGALHIDPVATVLTVITLGAAWSLAVIVTGLIAAWRSAAMTLAVERVLAGDGRPGPESRVSIS